MPKIEVKIPIGIMNDIFVPYLDNTSRFEIIYGGAGSGKSKFLAQRLVYRHLGKKGRKTLVLRKVGRTIRNSVFAEIVNVISEWECNKLFKVNKSDLEITCINGNTILFSGLDDVEKLKSIQGITDVWIEEASEISEDDFKQINLRLRGITEIPQQITLSFNPISALSWIKSYFFDTRLDNCKILKTTYRDNAFLNQEYIDEIERLKEVDPTYYKIYGLGEWGVLGNLVYSNYEIHNFDIYDSKGNFLLGTKYDGLDWGYNDPTALIRIGFKDREIYIYDEMYVKGLDNPELQAEAEKIISKSDLIIADNSEPKSIKEWRKAGWNIKAADKGKDSISFGIQFVRRHKIHIHPKCQNTINEIQGYCYEKDKDGNVLEKPVDFKNHLMDAKRYALEPLSKGSSFQLLDI